MPSYHKSSTLLVALLLTMPAAAPAISEPAPYCADLKHIANLAMTRERFSSIIGKPRQGNFRDTTMPLTGWKDCAFYGNNAYTCDSRGFPTGGAAALAQKEMVSQILSCLETWTEATQQSSPTYLALHPRLGPASITLSLDKDDDSKDIVRFTMFLRRP